jgi:potassium channel subfamily K, other eukaryote
MCRETVLEALEVGYRKRVAIVRRKRKEARRRRLVEGRWRSGIERRLRARRELVWVKDTLTDGDHPRRLKDMAWKAWHSIRIKLGMKEKKHHDFHHHHHHHTGLHLNLDALTPQELEATALEAGVPLDELLPADYMMLRQKRKQKAALASGDGDRSSTISTESVGIEEKIRRGFRSTEVDGLTQARMGSMIAMLGRFALAVQAHGGPDPPAADLHHHHDDDDISDHHLHPGVELTRTWTSMTVGNENETDSGATTPRTLDSFRHGIEKEERRAFLARFVVAWTLFITFWLVR